MSSGKCGLDPLVECSENNEGEESNISEQNSQNCTIPYEQKTTDDSKRKLWTSSSKSSDIARQRKCGSRMSLASLFSFSGQSSLHRERSRSGWSYSDESNSVPMTSVSTSDIRSAVSGSSSLTRYNGSESSNLMQSNSDNGPDMLLKKDEEETANEAKESKKEKNWKQKLKECPLCASTLPISQFPKLKGCQHRSCRTCLRQYVELSINENRVEIPCPECSSFLQPSDVKLLVGDMTALMEKYEQFSVRRYLMTESDTRWCPAPDCGYAVIASRCAACPQLKCERPECGMLFCYHCKREWHNNQTCDEARLNERKKIKGIGFDGVFHNSQLRQSGQESVLKPGDLKACPRCRTYIVKMDDGSCNHMVCTMCTAEFCWLCLKEISDLHYLSPTGCTFWGKKPWTRKKKLLWQLGTLVGAPVGIALIAGLSIPGIIFGVPVVVGRKVHHRFMYQSKFKRRFLTVICVVGSLIVSPVMAVMAVGVGVPILLAYVYGVVPLSLCRNGGCGITSADSQMVLTTIDEEQLYGLRDLEAKNIKERREEVASIEPSLHSSLSVPMDGRVYRHPTYNDLSKRKTSLESCERTNYEEASVKAMAGSHYNDDKSLHTLCSGNEVTSMDEQASTRAMAGSAVETKSFSGSFHRNHQKKEVEQDTKEGYEDEEEMDDDQPSTSSGPANKKSSLSSGSRIPCVIDMTDEMIYIAEEGSSLLQPIRSVSRAGSQSDSRIDLSMIRGWLDNMKQMVSSDSPQEKPYEPSTRHGSSKMRRSGSGKSIHTIQSASIGFQGQNIISSMSNVSQNEANHPATTLTLYQQQHQPKSGSISSKNETRKSKKKKRGGFFSNLFGRSKSTVDNDDNNNL